MAGTLQRRRSRRMTKGRLLLIAGTALTLATCAGPPEGEPSPAALGDPATESPSEWSGETRLVPQDYPTIQAAGRRHARGPGPHRSWYLSRAGRGDHTGPDRARGRSQRRGDRRRVSAPQWRQRPLCRWGSGREHDCDQQHIKRLLWSGVRGYRRSYLTAVNNAVYGIYALDSSDGLFEHSYASGSPDAGFYIGQCDPCQAIITDSISEWNGLGYSGTNASSDLYIVNSTFRHNVAGIAPNTLDSELPRPSTT